MTENYHWYVIQTRPRWEKKVARLLADKGIAHYCPLQKKYNQWSDRKKLVEEPLFKSYIFVHVIESQKWDVRSIGGVINYVYWLGKPAIVKDKEIELIKKFLQEFDDVEVVNTDIELNDPVVVASGIMMDYKGIVVEIRGTKARVSLESMGFALTATFDKKNLRPA